MIPAISHTSWLVLSLGLIGGCVAVIAACVLAILEEVGAIYVDSPAWSILKIWSCICATLVVSSLLFEFIHEMPTL